MLILASASPRRQELLRNAGISFRVQPADIDEAPLPGELPQACAERLAREKVLAVHRSHPQEFVLGADTIVVVDGIILGKPRDENDAARMLRLLSGRTHTVITGVCLAAPLADRPSVARSELEKSATGNRQLATASESTLVTMSAISDHEIRDYIATGEPMDKAGAYAIQGVALHWIPRIEGDYSNVVGLPVARVRAMLRESGALRT
jgi:septum formation protein